MSALPSDVGFLTGVVGPNGYISSVGWIYFSDENNEDAGFTGSVGFTGSFGSTGFVGSASTVIGFTGSVGNIGFTGSASTVIGFTGSAGYLGSFGYTGSTFTQRAFSFFT